MRPTGRTTLSRIAYCYTAVMLMVVADEPDRLYVFDSLSHIWQDRNTTVYCWSPLAKSCCQTCEFVVSIAKIVSCETNTWDSITMRVTFFSGIIHGRLDRSRRLWAVLPLRWCIKYFLGISWNFWWGGLEWPFAGFIQSNDTVSGWHLRKIL